MDTISLPILELLENEIKSCNNEVYQKTIPIEQYNFEIKRALDKLIEKYGGIVKRFDDKVSIIIKFEGQSKINKPDTPNFDELNSVFDRLTKMEIKINSIMETQKITTETNKRFQSYMNYFKNSKEGQTLKTLVEEILSHR